MAILIVNTALDEQDNDITDGDVSLRDALAAAQAGDVITFDPAIFNGEPIDTINLTLGELVISNGVTIDGDLNDDGLADVTVSGDANGDDLTTTDALGNTITDASANTNDSDNTNVFSIQAENVVVDGLVITGGGTGVYIGSDTSVVVQKLGSWWKPVRRPQ